MKVFITADTQTARAPRYQAPIDQFDALWALCKWMMDEGYALPPKVTAWVAQAEAVKLAIPKPPPAPGGGDPDPYDL